jgi:hypothetical protein
VLLIFSEHKIQAKKKFVPNLYLEYAMIPATYKYPNFLQSGTDSQKINKTPKK